MSGRRQPKTTADLAAAVSEEGFQAQVIDLAESCGWLVIEFEAYRKAARGRFVGEQRSTGWPDLTLIRDRVIFRELKSQRGRVRPDQEIVIGALERAGADVKTRPFPSSSTIRRRVTFGAASAAVPSGSTRKAADRPALIPSASRRIARYASAASSPAFGSIFPETKRSSSRRLKRAGSFAPGAAAGDAGEGRMNWMTPAQVDQERVRWRRWKPQRGGWNQSLWIRVQEQWRMGVMG